MVEPMFDLSGKVALVTGISRGLGRYFARALVRAGDVAITSRDMQVLSAFAEEIRAIGRNSFSAALDVGDYSSIQNAVFSIEEYFGHIDILASESSRYITGQTLLVDGGISTGATKAILS